MKKELRHRLFSWVFTLVFLFPLGGDFLHIVVKHHSANQIKSIIQIKKVETSCAVFHKILNYNSSLNSNAYTIFVYSLLETSIFFKPLKFHDLNRFYFALRAPPVC